MTAPQSGSSGRRIATEALTIQVGRSLQIALNAGTFIVLARVLGVAAFGELSSLIAVLTAVFALADLGFGQLAVRAVAQHNPTETWAMRSGIPLMYLASGLLAVASCIIAWVLSRGHPDWAVACGFLSLSYLFMQARVNLDRGYWLGALRFNRAVAIDVLTAALRLLGVLAAVLIAGRSLGIITLCIGVSGLLSIVLVKVCLAYPIPFPFEMGSRREVVTEGIRFALTSLLWNLFTEIPKLILAAVASLSAVGEYTAAFRVLAIAFLPLQSTLNVITPRVFAAAAGRGGHTPLARTLINVFLLGSAFGVGLWFSAPLLPILLGPQYRATVRLLRVCAISLPCQAIAFIAGDWLGGLGRQGVRLVLTGATLVVAIPVGYAASRSSGALGTAWVYTGMTALLAVLTVVTTSRIRRA